MAGDDIALQASCYFKWVLPNDICDEFENECFSIIFGVTMSFLTQTFFVSKIHSLIFFGLLSHGADFQRSGLSHNNWEHDVSMMHSFTNKGQVFVFPQNPATLMSHALSLQ